MPLWPIDIPPQATTGHACQGAFFGAVATASCSVGTFQLTSPTSVEPPSGGPGFSRNGTIVSSRPAGSVPVAF